MMGIVEHLIEVCEPKWIVIVVSVTAMITWYPLFLIYDRFVFPTRRQKRTTRCQIRQLAYYLRDI